jgi:septal ring factor EnvC (AmiA/AmiB activator)
MNRYGGGFRRYLPTTEAAIAEYAAAILADLNETARSWPTAVAQYHSRDEDRGAYYQKKVYDLWYGQRDNLVASAAGLPVLHSAVARQRMTEQEAMLEQRAKKAELQRIRDAARAANAAFLQRQAASPRPGTRPRSKPARQRPWQHSRK